MTPCPTCKRNIGHETWCPSQIGSIPVTSTGLPTIPYIPVGPPVQYRPPTPRERWLARVREGPLPRRIYAVEVGSTPRHIHLQGYDTLEDLPTSAGFQQVFVYKLDQIVWVERETRYIPESEYRSRIRRIWDDLVLPAD